MKIIVYNILTIIHSKYLLMESIKQFREQLITIWSMPHSLLTVQPDVTFLFFEIKTDYFPLPFAPFNPSHVTLLALSPSISWLLASFFFKIRCDLLSPYKVTCMYTISGLTTRGLAFMVPEVAMKTSKGNKQLSYLSQPSDAYKLQQGPARYDNPKDTIPAIPPWL